ncbi:MAG: outer membrane protein assembly factor BamD [Limisphaerales bacterium]
MRSSSSRWWWLALALVLVSRPSPAPLIYKPGEGWTYESVGGGKWQRTRAKDQFEVAQEAFDAGNYGLARKAARRVVKVWPLSDYAPRAQYLVARSEEERGDLRRAFREYERLVERFPKTASYEETLERQKAIGDSFLAGKWYKLWGFLPWFPTTDKAVEIYSSVVRAGPYSPVAPTAQMQIGSAHEKQRDYLLAVRAYERAADRYSDQPAVVADAFYRAGMAWREQAREADYDQSAAGKAIAAFGDFATLFPEDPRIPETQGYITELYRTQAEGSYRIARYYEKRGRDDGAVIYYSDVADIYSRQIKEPEAPLAVEARQRIADIRGEQARESDARRAADLAPQGTPPPDPQPLEPPDPGTR